MTALPYACHYDSSLIPPQYWLVHRTHVDVPSMYRPHGRYRYTYGVVSFSESRSYVSVLDHQCSQNWRAAAAMIVSVPLTLPGLIHSINNKIHVDVVGTRLFD